MNKKYHYFYKITNLLNGYFYYGIHSTNNLNDGYMGSGKRLRCAYEKYGIENFTKEILNYFNTRKEASDYEAEIVTESLVKDTVCYNVKLGGDSGDYCASGKVTVKNKKGEYFSVNKDDPRFLNGELTVIWKNRKHTPETKQKMHETFKKRNHQQGEKNSQYGTCWVYNNQTKENKKIKKEELGVYLNQGFEKGRSISGKGIKQRKYPNKTWKKTI